MTLLDERVGAEAEPGPTAPPVVLPGLTLSDLGRLSRGTRKRRSVPIMGYNGLNGSGKTRCMVADTLPDLALGRRVLSTVALLDPHTGNPHPGCELFRSWQQLHEFSNGVLLLDEVTGIMDSRDGQSGMPKHIRKLLPQLRRLNVPVRWTGIDWDNSDRRLRQLTQAVAMCKGYLHDTKAMRSDGDPTALPMWAPNRLFSVITLDAQRLNQSEDSQRLLSAGDPGATAQAKRRRPKVLNREWVRGPGSIAFRAYNTLDAVLSVDASCPICGLRIPEKYCKGHDVRADHVHEKGVRDPEHLSRALDAELLGGELVDLATGEVVRVPVAVGSAGR